MSEFPDNDKLYDFVILEVKNDLKNIETTKISLLIQMEREKTIRP